MAGSRLSYTFAYYLGWSLTKVRRGVQILKGSDSTTIDWLTNAPDDSLVVVITTSRYPNELIRVGKVARRLHESHPDGQVTMMSYILTAAPPKSVLI